MQYSSFKILIHYYECDFCNQAGGKTENIIEKRKITKYKLLCIDSMNTLRLNYI